MKENMEVAEFKDFVFDDDSLDSVLKVTDALEKQVRETRYMLLALKKFNLKNQTNLLPENIQELYVKAVESDRYFTKTINGLMNFLNENL